MKCISGAKKKKKKNLKIAVFIQVFCGQHDLLSKPKSKCKVAVHAKEIA